jgi:hypothetical protein
MLRTAIEYAYLFVIRRLNIALSTAYSPVIHNLSTGNSQVIHIRIANYSPPINRLSTSY